MTTEIKPYSGLRLTGPISEVYNEDNMIGMARYPDKFFDLAVVDPPYGINAGRVHSIGKRNCQTLITEYTPKNWDSQPPGAEYFNELFRISKNQIIWGANYFTPFLPASRGWILWDKGYTNDCSYSDAELAFTSFDRCVKACRLKMSDWRNCISNNKEAAMASPNRKIHPTQKPVALYAWLLQKFAGGGYRILDTHMGSQSSRIAAYRAGLDYYGWELDAEYFEAGCKRFKEQTAQLQLNFNQ